MQILVFGINFAFFQDFLFLVQFQRFVNFFISHVLALGTSLVSVQLLSHFIILIKKENKFQIIFPIKTNKKF